ncbi:MAG: L-histidine N(alpha)-methyltransferase, partial [Marinirhabdus sp.]
MKKPTERVLDTTFKKDVFEGLTATPKYLYSQYIYDKKGDKLFQDIMAMPEYYLTNCELEIFVEHTPAIAGIFDESEKGFDLIELGAGDGKKTKILLKYLSENNFNFTYKPIDISQNAIDGLTETLKKELPNIKVFGETGEYFEVLERLKKINARKKVLLFLGSNIGNLLHEKAIDFLSKLCGTLHGDDVIFMGFDQKKHPQTILDAYNDANGITEAFNKNLLHRINVEMGANFPVNKFMHWQVYDPETGTAKSYLMAKEAVQVQIPAIQLQV